MRTLFGSIGSNAFLAPRQRVVEDEHRRVRSAAARARAASAPGSSAGQRARILERVGDGIAAVAAEGAARDLDPGRRLAALVFGAVEHAPDVAHHRLVMAARDDLGHRHLALDQALQDVVEHLVGRQRVLVGLVGLQLGARRLGDDALGHDPARSAPAAPRPVLVAPARQREHRHLVDVLQHRVAAAHVAIERGIARRHLRLVAGRQHHPAEFVGKRHQRHAAGARLDVLLGDVGGAPGEGRRQHRRVGLHRRADIDAAQLRAQERRDRRRVLEAVARGDRATASSRNAPGRRPAHRPRPPQ